MTARTTDKIQRKIIQALPIVLVVIGLGYFLLGSHDSSVSNPQNISNTKAEQGSHRLLDEDRSSNAAADAWSLPGWLGGHAQSSRQPSSDNVRQADAPQANRAPEPVFMEDPGIPTEQHVADVSQRAVHGANPHDKVLALMELAVVGDVHSLDTLSEALRDSDSQVRLAAVTSAQRLAQFKGDENGDIRRWLVQAGYDADAQLAAQARAAANEVAENYGEQRPFP